MADGKTAATRFLEKHGVEFSTHRYDYRERGGALHAAECLDVQAHVVVKTLVMRTDAGRRLLVLMHGDRQVSSKRLAREVGARRISSCAPQEALTVTGYVIGGISPFGTQTALSIYVEKSIFALSRIFINGGRRGLLLGMEPRVLRETLDVIEVSVARP